jgi:hypothetical protein
LFGQEEFENTKGVIRICISNKNRHIEEEQTTQWPKEKVLKDKQGYDIQNIHIKL